MVMGGVSDARTNGVAGADWRTESSNWMLGKEEYLIEKLFLVKQSLLSDESTFSLQSDSHQTFIWRAPGTRYHQKDIIE
ncbi:hypothetical protein TNCV_1426231 [Trichonephila clavipes]|nr:hypothetical protein TNCV_1426231 [Trichonephila clavipes]